MRKNMCAFFYVSRPFQANWGWRGSIDLAKKVGSHVTGSAKANGREPKTGLGQVSNYKLGCSDYVHLIMYTDAHPYL